MKQYYFLIFVLFLFIPGFITAAETQPTSVDPDDILEPEPVPVYGICPDSDDEFDDDDEFPENVIARTYENGRMAFLFGKFDIAFKAWEPLAQQGYNKAQASLGWMYHTGNGVKKDIKQAIKWYTLAAEQNHEIAQNNLAVFYENGQGVIADKKLAFDLYKQSAKAGYSFAQYNLGRMYAEGHGTGKNLSEARYWWRIASRNKIKKATEALALLDKKPKPTRKSDKPKQAVAHAPYHANPVAKGLAWVKKQAVNHYTIQLLRTQDEEWLLKLAASEQLPETITRIKSTTPSGDAWYILIYGSFSSFQEAESVRKDLPANLKKWSPKLRRFGEIHQLIK